MQQLRGQSSRKEPSQ